MPETIIQEVRKIRDNYARQFNYDLHAMCADLRRDQRSTGAKVVSFSKRPIRLRPPNKRMQPARRPA